MFRILHKVVGGRESVDKIGLISVECMAEL